MKDKIFLILSVILILIVIIFIFIFIKTPSVKQETPSVKQETPQMNEKTDTIKENIDKKSEVQKNFTLIDFYSEDPALLSKIDSIYNSFKRIDEKIGQMIVIVGGRNGVSDERVINAITNHHAGGVMLLNGSMQEFKNSINKFKEVAIKTQSIPLIFSCDGEPSLINRKIKGLSFDYPKTSEITDTVECRKTTSRLTSELKQMGFNQNFAPVCDFNLNKQIIGDRSFGKDVKKVSDLSKIFIDETQKMGIVATAKHFPGHGNVKGDSHKGVVVSDNLPKEVAVFKNVIEDGVISVMVGHIAIKGGKYDTENKPSTLNYGIVTNYLKKELNFKGIVITDAMNMGGVTSFDSPSLKAIIAGCDMILFPSDEKKLIESIKAEISTNEKLSKQVEESVKKIIKLKICLGFFNNN